MPSQTNMLSLRIGVRNGMLWGRQSTAIFFLKRNFQYSYLLIKMLVYVLYKIGYYFILDFFFNQSFEKLHLFLIFYKSFRFKKRYAPLKRNFFWSFLITQKKKK